MLMKTAAQAYTKPMTAIARKPCPIYIVYANWDDEAQVWVAESADVPGLVAEAGSIEKLAEELRELVPMMLQLNHEAEEGVKEVAYEILARRLDVAPMEPLEPVEPVEA